MLPNSHERLELEGHVKIWRKWRVGDSHGSIWLFKESFEAKTKTPAHHDLVHSWQPKLCVTKNKFALKDKVFYPVRILNKRASEDRSQTSCLGAVLEKCAQPQCLVWEFPNIVSNCVDWVPHSDFVNVKVLLLLGSGWGAIQVAGVVPVVFRCEIPSHQDSLSDWSDSDSDASSYESVEEWPGVPSKKTGGKKGLDIDKGSKRSK